MKRLALLLPLLALAAGCARSSLPSEMPVPEPPRYRTVQLDAEPGPAEGGGSGGLSCRIVEIFPNDYATFRFENRTDTPVFVNLESVVDASGFFGFYAPGLIFLRAYDDEGRACSTNARGASPDGFWSPGMESGRIPSDKEIAKRETAVPPGEGIVWDIHIPEFFGSAAPSTRMAAVEPAASVRLPSGERRTIVGPRISYSPSERGEIRSWTDWFRKQTDRPLLLDRRPRFAASGANRRGDAAASLPLAPEDPTVSQPRSDSRLGSFRRRLEFRQLLSGRRDARFSA